MLQIGNTLKFCQIFFSWKICSQIFIKFFFLGKYASKEKRSVKYCLIFSEFCCHKCGRIPLTSKLGSLNMSMRLSQRQVQTNVWYLEWSSEEHWYRVWSRHKEHGIRLGDTRTPGFKWVISTGPVSVVRTIMIVIPGSGWRESKKSIREEKEKFESNFSHFERRKRNLNSLSPVSRREREIWKPFL